MTLLQAWQTDILLCKTLSVLEWILSCQVNESVLFSLSTTPVRRLLAGESQLRGQSFPSLAMTHSCGAIKFVFLTRVPFGVTCLWLCAAVNGWCPHYTFDIVTKQQIFFVICCFRNYVVLSMGNGGNSKRMLSENSHQIASAVNGIRRSLDWIWRLI